MRGRISPPASLIINEERPAGERDAARGQLQGWMDGRGGAYVESRGREWDKDARRPGEDRTWPAPAADQGSGRPEVVEG